MNCPTCGTLLPEPAHAFCGDCGAHLSAPPVAPTRSIQIEYGSLTHVGITRAEPNQDQILAALHPTFGLFAVADGMGGHQFGEVASAVALERLHGFVSERLGATAGAPSATALDPTAFLRLAMLEAHAAVSRFNQVQRADAGSTLTAALLLGDQLYIGHVGDSRAYLVRDHQLTQLTDDHSLVGDLFRKGMLTKDEIYTHPRRAEIFQSLGQPGRPPQVELHQVTVAPGLQVLLCSDGLWEMVRDPQIAAILAAGAPPTESAEALIKAANDGGGEDNISVVILRFHT